MEYISNFLVTGGSGYIGKRLVEYLRKEGKSVRVLSRKKSENGHVLFIKQMVIYG